MSDGHHDFDVLTGKGIVGNSQLKEHLNTCMEWASFEAHSEG